MYRRKSGLNAQIEDCLNVFVVADWRLYYDWQSIY